MTDHPTYAPPATTPSAMSTETTPSPLWRSTPLESGHGLPPLFALVGASGGVGVTSLAAMWAPAADSGQLWPAHTDTTQWCLLVGRLTLPGVADVAHRLRTNELPAGVDVFGIVWVPPRPGRLPKEVSRYAATVSELSPSSWTVPWIEELTVTARTDIAAWRPSTVLPDKRHTDLTTCPPPAVCHLGRDIVDAAAARYRTP